MAVAKVGLMLVAVVLLAAAILWPEIPSWRTDGTASLPLPLVGTNSGSDLCPGRGGVIELRGDSLVVGGRMDAPVGSLRLPYGMVLERELGDGRRVILNGRGGAVAADGAALAERRKVRSDLLLIAFGTNDSAPRGWMRSKTPVPLDQYAEALVQQIANARAAGSRVALIAPPLTGSAAINLRIAPYRREVRAVGEREGLTVFDPAEAMLACQADEPLLVRDALHLNTRGHACIGKWLAQNLCGPMRSPSGAMGESRPGEHTTE